MSINKRYFQRVPQPKPGGYNDWWAVMLTVGPDFRIVNLIQQDGTLQSTEGGGWLVEDKNDAELNSQLKGGWKEITRKEAMKPVKNRQSRIARKKQREANKTCESELTSLQRHIDTQENG